MKTVLGIFENSVDAKDAIGELKDEGYNAEDISIVMKDREEGEAVADETGASVAEGAVSGAATGAILGGLAGLLASVALPGLGAFFVGGPIAAALGLGGAAATTISGATTGGLVGGLLGALTGFGLTEREARTYEERVREGATLIAVPARRGEEAEVESLLAEYNATDIKIVAPRNIDDEEILASDRSRTHHGEYAFAGNKGGKTRRAPRR